MSTVYFTATSIGHVSSIAPDLTRAKVSATRILSLLKRKPQIDASKDDGIKLGANLSLSLSLSLLTILCMVIQFFPSLHINLQDEVSGSIAADSVHFSYPSRSKVKVLQGLTVSIKPGQTLALVGPSGCGKSTLVSLIERFYDPTGGHVTLEGTEIKSLNLNWLHQQSGIAENILYGALYRDVSDEEVIEVAKSANIHNFIESLPMVRSRLIHLSQSHVTHILTHTYTYTYAYAIRVHNIYDIIVIFRSYTIMYDIPITM